MCWLKTMHKHERNVESREQNDNVCCLTVSSLLFKLSCSLTLFDICCISYPINLSTVKIDVFGNIAEVLVERSDHGAKGGARVKLDHSSTKVDEIAI